MSKLRTLPWITPLLFLCFMTASCSWISSTPESEMEEASAGEKVSEEQSADSKIKKDESDAISPQEVSPLSELTGQSASDQDTSLEIVWQVPGEGVDTYHLHYGTSRDNLDNHIIIPVYTLEKIDHPIHGPVYKYNLKGAPQGKTIYLQISAENELGKKSEPSEIVELKAE